MVRAVAEHGYSAVAVEDVLQHGGVSRSTFYERFSDKHDCFIAAQRAISDHLCMNIELGLGPGDPHLAHETVIGALAQFATDHPSAASVLFIETLAAGPQALDLREKLISALGRSIDTGWAKVGDETPLPDISARALVGGVFRILGSRTQRGEGAMHGVLPDLLAWASSYQISTGTPRWRAHTRATAVPLPERPAYRSMPQPEPLPRGRHKLTATEVARNQRDRILYAVADLAAEDGYSEMTVTDICTRSRVSRKVFYTHYVDKHAAALEAHELGVQQMTAVTAKAFFSVPSWPERIWQSGLEFVRFLMDYPSFAHLGFVETQTIGAAAVQRIDDALVTFTVFLQEGYRQQTVEQAPPERAVEAIAATVFEIVFHEVRRRQTQRLPLLLPDVAYICLAPFVSPQAANGFIDRVLSGESTDSGAAPPP